MLRVIIVAAMVLVPCAAASTITVPIDQPTIQAAVDAAVAGDTIVIKAGVYSEAVAFQNLDNLTVTGKGKVRLVAPIDDTALTITGCTGVTLQKLRFEGPGSGLVIDGCLDITVTKCRFQSLDDGIAAIGASVVTIEDSNFLDIRDNAVSADSGQITATHNRVQRAGFGFHLVGCVLNLSDNKLLDLLNSGVYVDTPQGDVDSGIVGNLIDRCGVCGIRCHAILMDTAHFTIGENVIRNVTHTAIDLALGAASGIIIENNSIHNAGTAGVQSAAGTPLVQCLFAGNDVRKVRGFGLDLLENAVTTSDLTLSNNFILGAGLDGIVTAAVALSGNQVLKCGRVGVLLTDESATAEDHSTLTGNTLLGSSLFDLYNPFRLNSILPDNTIGSTGP